MRKIIYLFCLISFSGLQLATSYSSEPSNVTFHGIALATNVARNSKPSKRFEIDLCKFGGNCTVEIYENELNDGVFLEDMLKRGKQNCSLAYGNAANENDSLPLLILAWTRYFEEDTIEFLLKDNNMAQCPYRCDYSNIRALECHASIILFHMRNQITPLPAKRAPHQYYSFFLLESPIHSGEIYKSLPRDFFNISFTYLPQSDVFYPYDAFDKIENGEVAFWKVQQKVAMKSDLALQFVSNCHTSSRRELYVEELKKHIKVTQRGDCVPGMRKADCDGECAQKLIDSHLFYLAFENSVCQNYVTEKFWNLKKLIVPVVLSRSVFAGLNIPNNSFIAADDFCNAKKLAEHLEMLVANRDQYAKLE